MEALFIILGISLGGYYTIMCGQELIEDGRVKKCLKVPVVNQGPAKDPHRRK